MAVKKVNTKAESKENKINIEETVREYTSLSEKIKTLETRKKELADRIKKYAQENGVKNTTGSYLLEDDNFTYGAVARKSVSLNAEKAENFFKHMGLWDKVIDVKEVINEDKIEALINEGILSMEDLEEITDIKVTYSVFVEKKKKEEDFGEDIPEVQVAKSENSARGRVSHFKRKK